MMLPNIDRFFILAVQIKAMRSDLPVDGFENIWIMTKTGSEKVKQ